jgi:hypothetical protein
MFVDIRISDEESATQPRFIDHPMFQHPRVPGELWEAIGWNQQCAANLAADSERGAYQRKGWFGTSNPDRAA